MTSPWCMRHIGPKPKECPCENARDAQLCESHTPYSIPKPYKPQTQQSINPVIPIIPIIPRLPIIPIKPLIPDPYNPSSLNPKLHEATLRVQVPNNQILTPNQYYKYYYPKPKYVIIGYLDPLQVVTTKRTSTAVSKVQASALIIALLPKLRGFRGLGFRGFRV